MKRTTKNPSRKLQVEGQLAEMLARVAIPELSERFELVSITHVELTQDLKLGTVWVTASPSVVPEDLIVAMAKRLPVWRRTLRERLSLRYFPNLSFRYDSGQADIIRVEAILEGK